MAFSQLSAKDLRCGDILLMASMSGSKVHSAIQTGQWLAGQLNSWVSHAGVMGDNGRVVEAGLHGIQRRTITDHERGGYLVFRCVRANLGDGAGTCADILADVNGNYNNLSYGYWGAALSIFRGGSSAQPSRSETNQFLDRVFQGRSNPFFCSEFVATVYSVAAYHNGIAPAQLFSMHSSAITPSVLGTILVRSPFFDEAGYIMAGG